MWNTIALTVLTLLGRGWINAVGNYHFWGGV